ncbi:hypothetical protein ACFX2A_017943 [Malus domestica]
MGGRRLQGTGNTNDDVVFSCSSGIRIRCSPLNNTSQSGGLFASVQVARGFGITPSPQNSIDQTTKLLSSTCMTYMSTPGFGFWIGRVDELVEADALLEVAEAEELLKIQKINGNGGGLRLKIKVGNASLRRLLSGAVAGVVSRTAVAPLETIRTHLMVGGSGHSSASQVFHSIMEADGWQGLFRGTLVNVIRVAPCKAIEEGPAGLYRGLTPSLIGVIPYAAANYFAYDALSKAYKKAFKKEEIGNITTLLIGSAAAAISSSATFPLEVARKRMQVGALSGRQYKHIHDALSSIHASEGIGGLYKGLGPSYMKLVPAAGISFMCYEACKRIPTENEEEI